MNDRSRSDLSVIRSVSAFHYQRHKNSKVKGENKIGQRRVRWVWMEWSIHRLFQLSAVGNADLGLGFPALAAVALHLLDNVKSFHHLTEDNMLPV